MLMEVLFYDFSYDFSVSLVLLLPFFWIVFPLSFQPPSSSFSPFSFTNSPNNLQPLMTDPCSPVSFNLTLSNLIVVRELSTLKVWILMMSLLIPALWVTLASLPASMVCFGFFFFCLSLLPSLFLLSSAFFYKVSF